MIQEEKNLLLVDIGGRILYGIRVRPILEDGISLGEPEKVINIDYLGETIITDNGVRNISVVKPILRSMSNMDREEKGIYDLLCSRYNDFPFRSALVVDWLNENLFDFRGLLKKNLAIEE